MPFPFVFLFSWLWSGLIVLGYPFAFLAYCMGWCYRLCPLLQDLCHSMSLYTWAIFPLEVHLVHCHLDGHIGAAWGGGDSFYYSEVIFLVTCLYSVSLHSPGSSTRPASCPPYSLWYSQYPQYGIQRLAWCLGVAQLILLEWITAHLLYAMTLMTTNTRLEEK